VERQEATLDARRAVVPRVPLMDRHTRSWAKLLERADMYGVSSNFCEEVCLGFLKLSWVSRKFVWIEERMIHNTKLMNSYGNYLFL
jgi:hypothetical protein